MSAREPMGPGDIDRELCEIRDEMRAKGSASEYDCLRLAYGLGLRQGRAIEQMIVAEERKALAAMTSVGIQKVEIAVADGSTPSRVARAVRAALSKFPGRSGA